MLTRLKQWRCSRRAYWNAFGNGHGPLRKEKLMGGSYRFTCVCCGVAVHEVDERTELVAAKEAARATPLTVELPHFIWGFMLDAAKAGATRERNGPDTLSRKAAEDAYEEARKAIEKVLDIS